MGAELSGAANYKKDAGARRRVPAGRGGARRRSPRTARSASTPTCSSRSSSASSCRRSTSRRRTRRSTRGRPRRSGHDDPASTARASPARWSSRTSATCGCGYEYGRLEAALTNTRISSMPRAVGRAARTMLSFAPLEVREIRVTYLQGPLPLATYTFINTPLLQRYFNGMASREQLRAYVAIEYAEPQPADRSEKDRRETLAAFEEPLPEGIVMRPPGRGHRRAARRERARRPAARAPGPVHATSTTRAARSSTTSRRSRSYDRPLGDQHLPPGGDQAHGVRERERRDAALQQRAAARAHRRRRVQAREPASSSRACCATSSTIPRSASMRALSAGIYEEMFSGVGGQVLYLPPRRRLGGRRRGRLGEAARLRRLVRPPRLLDTSPRSPRSTTAWRRA